MNDNNTAYAIQGIFAPSVFLTTYNNDLSLLGFGGPNQFGSPLWLPFPVGDDVYAIFYVGEASFDRGSTLSGLAVTMQADNSATIGPYQGLLSQQFQIRFPMLDYCVVTSLQHPGGSLAAYDMNGTSWGVLGPATWSGSVYALLAPPGWTGGGGALIPNSDSFMLVQPAACGTYPDVAGYRGDPLPTLPQPTSWDFSLPERLPADPAQDPLVGEMRIPFYLVTGDLSLGEQVQNNPWYVMRHYRYWNLLKPPYHRNGGAAETRQIEWDVGFETDSSASLSVTLGVSVQADGGFKLGGLSAGLQEKFTEQLGATISTTDKVLATEKVTDTYEFLDGEAALVAGYVIGHRYELLRADGTLIRSWDVVTDDTRTTANYSSAHPGGPSRAAERSSAGV